MLTGVSATEYSGHTGGGSNLLCLNLNISYTEGKYVDGFQGNSQRRSSRPQTPQ